MEHENTEIHVVPVDKSKIRKIWRVAAILGVITSLEFIIAFTVESGHARTFVFIALTIWKAFYIVSEFMHLGHERRALIWSILMPTVLIIFLIFILMYQGAALFDLRG